MKPGKPPRKNASSASKIRGLLPAPRGDLFDGLRDTGGHSHSKIRGTSIMEVASRFGKGFKPAPGGIEGAIRHLENKERASKLLRQRLGEDFGGARIMPTTFVAEYEVRDGVPIPWGGEVPASGRADEMVYRHKRLHYPVVPSLNQYINAMDVLTGNKSDEHRARILRDAFQDIDEAFGNDERARQRFFREAYENLSKHFGTEERRLGCLDDILRSMSIVHNKARIAHGDLHGENIRMFLGNPHLEDFGHFKDLQRARRPVDNLDERGKNEVIEGIGTDIVRATKNFKDIVPKAAVEERIERYVDGLDYPEKIKQGVRGYLQGHPWDADYEFFDYGNTNL